MRFSSVFRLILAALGAAVLGVALGGGIALWLRGTHEFLLAPFLTGVDVASLLVAGFGLVFVAGGGPVARQAAFLESFERGMPIAAGSRAIRRMFSDGPVRIGNGYFIVLVALVMFLLRMGLATWLMPVDASVPAETAARVAGTFWEAVYERETTQVDSLLAPGAPRKAADLLEAYVLTGPPYQVEPSADEGNFVVVVSFPTAGVNDQDDSEGNDPFGSAEQSDGSETRDTVSVFTLLRETSDGRYAVYCVGRQFEPEPKTGLLTCTR